MEIEAAIAVGQRIDDELGMEIGVFERVDRMDMVGMSLARGDDELIAVSLPVGRPAIHPHKPRLDPRPENDHGTSRRLDRQPILPRREVVGSGSRRREQNGDSEKCLSSHAVDRGHPAPCCRLSFRSGSS